MSSILILGGSGFIGSSLLDKLSKERHNLKVVVYKKNVRTRAERIRGNILQPGILDDHIGSGDTIINLIGQYSVEDSNFVDLNIKGGLNLLNSCIQKKRVRVILISSINVYGENMKKPSKETDPLRPTTMYGIVKLITERIYQYYSEVYGLDVTVLRLSNLYGVNKKIGAVSNLVNSLKSEKGVVAYNNGKQLRDYLFIDDAIDGIIQAIKTPQKGFKIFNISSSKRYMIIDLIRMIEGIVQKKLHVQLHSEIPDERCIWADNTKAKRIIKFLPKINIEKGLEITIRNLGKSVF